MAALSLKRCKSHSSVTSACKATTPRGVLTGPPRCRVGFRRRSSKVRLCQSDEAHTLWGTDLVKCMPVRSYQNSFSRRSGVAYARVDGRVGGDYNASLLGADGTNFRRPTVGNPNKKHPVCVRRRRPGRRWFEQLCHLLSESQRGRSSRGTRAPCVRLFLSCASLSPLLSLSLFLFILHPTRRAAATRRPTWCAIPRQCAQSGRVAGKACAATPVPKRATRARSCLR